MATRKEQILDTLRNMSVSTTTLSVLVGAPEPSVRRTIQALRSEGHYIEYVGGLATLREDVPAAAGVAGGAAF